MSDLENAIRIVLLGSAILFIPIGALAALIKVWKMSRRDATDAPALRDVVAGLQVRVDELEQRGLASGEVEAQYGRLAELEERIDFAERLLAQRDVLPPLERMDTPA